MYHHTLNPKNIIILSMNHMYYTITYLKNYNINDLEIYMRQFVKIQIFNSLKLVNYTFTFYDII